jgi:hypothetical protein
MINDSFFMLTTLMRMKNLLIQRITLIHKISLRFKVYTIRQTCSNPIVHQPILHKILIMTTKAGTTGILTGLVATAVIYAFFLIKPEEFLYVFPTITAPYYWITDVELAVLMIGGGMWAARWSGSNQPWRCAVLGALSGGLAGMIIYCLWGAAVAAQHVALSVVVNQAMTRVLALFTGGMLLGALGGLLLRIGRRKERDTFDMTAPQMAMNASITALPASLLAAALAALVSKRLAGLVDFDKTTATLPLLAALLLVLVSHLAVTLVVPHEARMAEHRCGTDEVKMLAFVGIAAAPVLILLLALIHPVSLKDPLVLGAVAAALVMSGISIHSLIRKVLPKRASFPEPAKQKEKAQALLFGSIAVSNAPRLIVLCVGCGLVMVLPVYAVVISVLIDINAASGMPARGIGWQVFLTQALACGGVCAIAAAALVLIYMVYLNFGRWFTKRSPG